ncbi:hypothetical protein BJX61DRAFT_160360 [Aspergillus egyptiacus]|nr:hypothetical protein BJX61DRAFT_160360 [Aspergillus egyptiacus]
MAPSLRDLIDFLLAEIALCGTQGASPIDILSFVDVFYSRFAQDGSNRNHVVDRRFQEKVWQWLTRNPEVSVGKGRQWNNLSLEDSERRQFETEDLAEEAGRSPVRVYVSKERTWFAIAGHEPDETKVLPLEFALLSIIASHKSGGIAQPDLIKLSGQDKRSVPKRTDCLQQKGYIEKRAIQVRSARTSLCTLRKFLDTENPAIGMPATQASEAAATSAKMIDFKWFTDTLFRILREHRIVSRSDLKDMLGFSDRWRWKILSRALRKFERIGVLKRVRAMSQYASTMKKYHPCVVLVRDPSEKDIESFHDFSKHMYSDMERNDDADAEFDDDAEADDPTREPSTQNYGLVEGGEDANFSGRVLPIWSPDRNMHNQIFEVIDRTGTTGCTNSDIMRGCLGVFYRRPLENTMARLVECWQLSQPPHLRHLAIVRDTALHRTITHYIHYSAKNFGKLVDAGEASWEAVEFVTKNKSDKTYIPPVDAKPQLDAYGLPSGVPAKDLLNNGDSTLLDCTLVVKPKDYNISSSDAKAIRLEGDTYTIQYGTRGSRPSQGLLRPLSGRRSPNTPKQLKVEDEEVSEEPADRVETPARKPRKKAKRDFSNLVGMSEQEKLEAMGMDETWTEYSVLLLQRPGTGVFFTPKGRRRATGQARGRPRVSRVAVFKSPKLFSFPWFGKEKGDAIAGMDVDTYTPQTLDEESSSVLVTSSNAEPHPAQRPTVHRGTKRPSRHRGADSESESIMQRASKVRRVSHAGNDLASFQDYFSAERDLEDERQGTKVNGHRTPSRSQAKRKRGLSPELVQQETVQVRGRGAMGSIPLTESVSEENSPEKRSPSKRPRVKSTHRFEGESPHPSPSKAGNTSSNRDQVHPLGRPVPAEELASVSEPGTDLAAEENLTFRNASLDDSAPFASNPNIDNRVSGDATFSGAPSNEPSTPGEPFNNSVPKNAPATPEGSKWRKSRSKTMDKGGSVSLIRRKIVLEIVEKAGGGYPMGPELWYPFMTAWMKTKYKERPDMRTVRTAVKNLVDAGKLRQQTFCGKDIKGVMVTKTIICKPDLPPDDPIIKDLQRKMLTTQDRYYFPPDVEVDPSLTRHGQTPRGYRRITEVPVEPSLTVQLHQKPAAILALEKRKEGSLQRRRLRKSELPWMQEYMQEMRPSGVVRLLSIQRPSSVMPPMHSMVSLFGERKHRGGPRLKRHRFPISSMAPYAMLMNPKQSFNPSNGTFSTNAGLSTLTTTRRMKRSRLPISAMAPYAMLMNPKQSFNPPNGTFSTNAGISTLAAARTAFLPQQYVFRSKAPHLPESLDDLFTQAQIRNVSVPGETDPRSRNFFRDNDRIMRWELRNEELLQQRTEDFHYINQTIQDSFESAPIEGGIRFDAETEVAPVSTVRTRQQLHPSRSYGSFVSFQQPPTISSYEWGPSPPRERSPTPINTILPSYNQPAPVIPKQRRIEKLNEKLAPSPSPRDQQPLRRSRAIVQLPRSLYQRLMTAIVVVRALAGGSDGKMVDWALVANCFPDYDPKVIQDKGKNYLSKNRLQVAKMQSDFHQRFLDAYADGEVPPINYNDLEGYDWNAVIEWATVQLDIPKSESMPDLPATREQFDQIFELREEPLGALDDFFQGQAVTINRKKTLLSHVPFATPLPFKQSTPRSQRQLELSRLETVKTWVRANTLTPAEVYRSQDAKQALSYIDGGLLNTALQSLVTERVISQNNKGRPVPGRAYDITEHFLHILSKRRPIEVSELRRAARFKKETLDRTLIAQGVHSLSYSAEDGEILAMINLFSSGQVTFVPRDPPRDKYGLTDGGYLTRMMNKDKLRFPVDIYSLENRYVSGIPISNPASTVPPPLPPQVTVNETMSLPERFPLWIDIHGGFIQLLWDLAVGAVLGCVATRPGITPSGIAGMLRPTMGTWEVRLLLQWLSEVGAVRKCGGGEDGDDDETSWVVLEWWWTVLY